MYGYTYRCIYIYTQIFTYESASTTVRARNQQEARRISCETAQEPKTMQSDNPRSFLTKDAVFTRCVYCPLLRSSSFLLISSSGGRMGL